MFGLCGVSVSELNDRPRDYVADVWLTGYCNKLFSLFGNVENWRRGCGTTELRMILSQQFKHAERDQQTCERWVIHVSDE